MNKATKIILFFYAVAIIITIFYQRFFFYLGGRIGLSLIVIALILALVVGRVRKEKINILPIFLPMIAIIAILELGMVVNTDSGGSAAINARIWSYLDQMKSAAAIWKTNQDSYIGFNTSGEGLDLENKIKELSSADYYKAIISVDAYCIKAKYVRTKNKNPYCCIDSKGYKGNVTDQYCTAEKPYCAE